MRFLLRLFKVLFKSKYRRAFVIYLMVAYNICKKGDFTKAIEQLNLLLESDNSDNIRYTTYKLLGDAYYWNGEYDKAEKALRKALELSMKSKSHDAVLYEALGKVCLKNMLYDEALMFYEKVAEFVGEDYWAKKLVDMDRVLKIKAFLEENKEDLPARTAYAQQNKHIFEEMAREKLKFKWNKD